MVKLKLKMIVLLVVFLTPFYASTVFAIEFKQGGVDWQLNASLRSQLIYQMSERSDNPAVDRTSFVLETPGNSWIRATAAYQKIAAVIEIGLAFNNGDDASFGAGVNENRYFRHAYVTYTIDEGMQLLVGRTWSLLALDGPYQRMAWDNGLWGAGDLFSFRHEQIQLSYKSGSVTTKVAIEDTFREDQLKYCNNFGLTGEYAVEDPIPALLGSITYMDKGVILSPSFFVQSYNLKSATEKDITVTSYAAALNAGYKTSSFGVSGEFWYGQNLYMHMAESNIDDHNGFKLQRYDASTIMGKPIANPSGDDIEDVISMGGWLQVALFFGNTTLRTGGGYQESETGLDTTGYEKHVATWAVFANYEYPIFQSFRVIPGVAYYNWGKDADKNLFGSGKNELGYDTFIGMFFQYDF